MNDDDQDVLKTALDVLREKRHRGSWLTWREISVLLAHIDAEPERLAAAVAREREEQRGADEGAISSAYMQLLRSLKPWEGDEVDLAHTEHQFAVSKGMERSLAILRAMPLTATPLADRIAKLEATLRLERDLFRETFFTPADKRAEKAEAERDALKAQLAEAVGALRGLRDEVSATLTGRDSEPGRFEEAWQKACAFLAKVKP